jgi:diamine N-acetyltransferase
MILKNDRIRLRPVEETDLNILYEWENDTNLWLLSNTVAPFSKHTLSMYIETAHEDIYTTKQLRLMIESQELNETVGCIDLFDFDYNNKRAGIGILVHKKEHRGQGFASDALELLKEYAFKTLDLHQLYCNILQDNESSVKLFEKYGFQKCGVKKEWIRDGEKWLDEEMYQVLKG